MDVFRGNLKQKERGFGVIKFKKLWDIHPSNNDNTFPCWNWNKSQPNFDNQCAIRMGVALHRCGFSFDEYKGVKCWFKCSEPHILRVEELVEYLSETLGEPLELKGFNHHQFKEITNGGKGIVAFINFWGRGLQGDHLDLFDGENMTYGCNDYFERSQIIKFWKLDV